MPRIKQGEDSVTYVHGTSEAIRFGGTRLGQMIYDFGFTRSSDLYLARKYGMKLKKLRELRAQVVVAIDEAAETLRTRVKGQSK